MKTDGTKGIVKLPELIMVLVHSASVPAILFVYRRLNEQSTTYLATAPVHMHGPRHYLVQDSRQDPRYYIYALLIGSSRGGKKGEMREDGR